MRLEVEVGGRRRDVALERRGRAFVATIDGTPLTVDAVPLAGGRWSIREPGSGRQWEVVLVRSGSGAIEALIAGARVPVRARPAGDRPDRSAGADGPARLAAPMPGKVVKLLVAVGQAVQARQGLVVVEAMKMENELRAARDGVVREILVAEGASVEAGAPLVVIE